MAKRECTECELAEIVRETPGLKWGYIGNFERWGDDRCLHIWVEGLEESNGNTKSLWSGEARTFDRDHYFNALGKIWAYKIGYEAGQKAANC